MIERSVGSPARGQVAGANGTTAGAYSLRLFVAGDANADGAVDGVDGQLVAAAMGSSAGQPGYSIGADANRAAVRCQANVLVGLTNPI